MRVADAAQFHDLPLTGQGRECEAVGHRLAEAAQVGRDPVHVLSAVLVPAKARDGLVEYEDCAVLAAQRLYLVQESIGRFVRARRLEHHAGDAPRVLVEQRLHGRDVVVAKPCGQRLDGSGNAAVDRRGADEPVVVGEEGAVGAKRHHVPAGVSARELQGGRHHRRAVLGELHHLRIRYEFEEPFRAFHFERRGPIEVVAQQHRTMRGLDHARRGVAERDGAQAHRILDVFAPVGIPDMATVATCDERRRVHGILIVALRRGVATSGDRAVRTLAQRERRCARRLVATQCGVAAARIRPGRHTGRGFDRLGHVGLSVRGRRSPAACNLAAIRWMVENGIRARSAMSSKPCRPSERFRIHRVASCSACRSFCPPRLS